MSATTRDTTTTQAPATDGGALATLDGSGSMMNFIANAVTNPNIDEKKLETLFRVQLEAEANDARRQFNRALHEAQKRMPRVARNGTIKLGTDKTSGKDRGSIPFAKWEDVDAIVRPIMSEYGFSVTFSNETRGPAGITWVATHRHIAGHQETNSITLPPDEGHGRNSLQAAGSTNSYAKRYLVEDFYNIVRVGADDDGKRGGTKYINDDEIVQIRSLLDEEPKPNEAEFFKWLGVRGLTEIPASQFTAALNALERRRDALLAGRMKEGTKT